MERPMRVEIKDDDPRHMLCIDLDAKTVRVGGRAVWLFPSEYRLLDVLSWCAGTMVSKEYVTMCLYGTLEPHAFNNVRTSASRLRKKLSASGGRNHIVGTRAGYMLA